MRHIHSWRTASFVLCLALGSGACGSVAAPEAGAPSVALPLRAATGMAATGRAASIGVGATRVLSARVNMRERMQVDARDGAIVVSFAERGRQGRVITLDPATLAVRAEAPLSIPVHAPYAVLPCHETRHAHVATSGGLGLESWTAGGAGAVFARRDADGSGGAREITPAGAYVMGQPQAASVDGRRVVLVYFLSGDEGFQVAATALDVEPPGALRLSAAP